MNIVMIIGHLPAGYITSKLIFPRFSQRDLSPKLFIPAGILGALAPDLDMFYFYLWDHRQHHHHTYWTHYPIVWIILLVFSLFLLRSLRRSKPAALMCIFSLNGLIHMILDTINGAMWWLAPFSNKHFALFTVSALHRPWWLNFILHWTFGFELAICIWAGILLKRSYSKQYQTAII